jgi:hypothetical protein
VELRTREPSSSGKTEWAAFSRKSNTNVYFDKTVMALGLVIECGEPGACL